MIFCLKNADFFIIALIVFDLTSMEHDSTSSAGRAAIVGKVVFSTLSHVPVKTKELSDNKNYILI